MSSSSPKKSGKILLADDSKTDQRIAELMLKQMGHVVVIVDNGMDAFQAAQSKEFDAILMDIDMPKMDGLTATKAIRNWEKTNGGHIPIVAYTAHTGTGEQEHFLNSGMDGYIGKPLIRKNLSDSLEKALSNL